MKTAITILLALLISLSFVSCSTETTTETTPTYFTVSNEVISNTNHYLFVQIDTISTNSKEMLINLLNILIKQTKENDSSSLNMIIHFSPNIIMNISEMSKDKSTLCIYTHLFGKPEKIGILINNSIMWYEI